MEVSKEVVITSDQFQGRVNFLRSHSWDLKIIGGMSELLQHYINVRISDMDFRVIPSQKLGDLVKLTLIFTGTEEIFQIISELSKFCDREAVIILYDTSDTVIKEYAINCLSFDSYQFLFNAKKIETVPVAISMEGFLA